MRKQAMAIYNLPANTQYQIPEKLAHVLLELAESLPNYDYSALCQDKTQQAELVERARISCPDLYQAAVEKLDEALNQRPYFVCIRGLKLDLRGLTLVLLSIGLGRLVRAAGQEDTPIHNEPEGVRKSINHPFSFYHTDNSNSDHPNDYTALACVSPDQNGGGASLILDVDTIVEGLETQAKLLEAIQENYPWFIATETDTITHYHPILDANKYIRWARENIFAAARLGGGKLASEQRQSVLAFEKFIAENANYYQFMLEPHDILIINNRKTVHARTHIENEMQSQRKILRTKMHQSKPA
jgi:hypothetical protein